MYQILSLHFTHTQSICIKSIYICLVLSTIEAFAVALVLVEWSSINCFMSKLYLHFLSKQTGLNASMVEISAELGLIVWKFREILFIWLFVKLFVSNSLCFSLIAPFYWVLFGCQENEGNEIIVWILLAQLRQLV